MNLTRAKYATTTAYLLDGDTLLSTNESGTVVQWFDYAPYGSVLAMTNTGQTAAARQFEGLFNDASNLVYSNARYLNPAQGQFITEDPVFWSLKQTLSNPQSLNSYSYALDNPIVNKDPSGLDTTSVIIGLIQQAINAIQQEINILSGGGGSAQSTTVAGASGSASKSQTTTPLAPSSALSWSRLSEQNLRVDKWSLCRV